MARTPRLERPHIDPSYGITGEAEGASWEATEAKLATARNYWVCTTRANGAPHAKPVWGAWEDGALWFGTGKTSVSGRNLLRDPRITVHLESGDDTVILEGRVERVTAAQVPKAAQDAYATKYSMPFEEAGGETAAEEPWFALRPEVVLTWLESDFVKTAARWVFEDERGLSGSPR